MNQKDNEQILLTQIKNYYSGLFEIHGRNEKALGWDKGRQEIRFEALTRPLEIINTHETFTLLDFGCGFGDLYKFLETKYPNMRYTGVDISAEFIESNRREWAEINTSPEFRCVNSHEDIIEQYDFVIASGTFNYKSLAKGEKYEKYVIDILVHLRDITERAMSVDFMSPNVDYKLDITHHQNITELVLGVIKPGTKYLIDATYLPYEYALTLYKGNEVAQ